MCFISKPLDSILTHKYLWLSQPVIESLSNYKGTCKHIIVFIYYNFYKKIFVDLTPRSNKNILQNKFVNTVDILCKPNF